MSRPKIDRSVIMEINAFENVINELYTERNYIKTVMSYKSIKGDSDYMKHHEIQLKLIERLIEIYEQ